MKKEIESFYTCILPTNTCHITPGEIGYCKSSMGNCKSSMGKMQVVKMLTNIVLEDVPTLCWYEFQHYVGTPFNIYVRTSSKHLLFKVE